MNRFFKLPSTTVILGLLLLAVSCGGGSKGDAAVEQAKQDSIAQQEALTALSKELKTTYDNDGKIIDMDGYIAVGSIVSLVKNGAFSAVLRDGPNSTDELLTNVQLNFGEDKANGIYLPEKYTDKDIVIFDKEKKEGTTKSRVKLTGKVVYTNKGEKKYNNPNVSEKIREIQVQNAKRRGEDPEALDYSYKITDVSFTILD